MPTSYVITIRGHLNQHWSVWFDGFTITNGDNGEAMLAGPIMDQAALHGLLAKIRDLGLPLIAVVPESTPEKTERIQSWHVAGSDETRPA
jgi:hypothetical protein